MAPKQQQQQQSQQKLQQQQQHQQQQHLRPSKRELVRSFLKDFVQSQTQDESQVAQDVFRMLKEESTLLYESQLIRDQFEQDPFDCFGEADEKSSKQIQEWAKSVNVVSCHRLYDPHDNVCLQAVVKCHPCQNTKSKNNLEDEIQLSFRYEKIPATSTSSTTIWYSIDVNKNNGPNQRLVNIQVWADGNKPSIVPAKSIDGDGDGDGDGDEWEDMDEKDEEDMHAGKEPVKKRSKQATTESSVLLSNKEESGNITSSIEPEKETKALDHEDEEEECDRYHCFVDPDVLNSFISWNNFTDMDEGRAFLLLMTFQFYEHEWDLVGFVLDNIFGYNEDDDEAII